MVLPDLIKVFFCSDYVLFDGGHSHQQLVIHWWLWMSLGVGPQRLTDKPLRKCLLWDCICSPMVSLFTTYFLTTGKSISNSALCFNFLAGNQY
jgi:hypothetical protein